MLQRIRLYCLLLGLCLYGVASTPTPDFAGWAEIFIAALLIIACAPKALQDLQGLPPLPEGWRGYAYIAALWGICVPTLTGLLSHTQSDAVLRDLIAYGYLFLPLWTYDLFQKPKAQRLLIITVAIMGGSFALRALASGDNMILSALLSATSPNADNKTYLANAPTLLLTASFGYIIALHLTISSAPLWRRLAYALILIALITPCLLAAAFTLQRATLAAFAIIAVAAHINVISRAPIKGSIITALTLAIAAAIPDTWQSSLQILSALSEKTQQHGLNMRAEEWNAALSAFLQNPTTVIFGHGWGGHFYSPATEGSYVNFTHSLISSSLLKTGLLSTFLLMGYGLTVANALYKSSVQSPLMVIAFAAPLAIDTLLYGAYKSLDFGVLLLLITVFCQPRPQLPEDKAHPLPAAFLPQAA